MSVGCLLRLNSFWVGYHYSTEHKRLCINFIPCFTVWIAFKDGLKPKESRLNFEIYQGK